MSGGAVTAGPVTAVLLDLDGTLTDSGPVILDACAHVLRSFGMQVGSREELMRFVGPPLPEGFRLLAGLEGQANAEAVRRYRAHYRQHMHEAPLYDGVEGLLAGLRRLAVPVCLATSKREDYAVEILRHDGLSEYFTCFAGSDPVDRYGAKEDVVRLAVARLQEAGADATRVVHVGGRSHDVEGAHAAGVECVGVLWGYGDEEELAGADWLVRTPDELLSLLTRLSQRQPRGALRYGEDGHDGHDGQHGEDGQSGPLGHGRQHDQVGAPAAAPAGAAAADVGVAAAGGRRRADPARAEAVPAHGDGGTDSSGVASRGTEAGTSLWRRARGRLQRGSRYAARRRERRRYTVQARGTGAGVPAARPGAWWGDDAGGVRDVVAAGRVADALGDDPRATAPDHRCEQALAKPAGTGAQRGEGRAASSGGAVTDSLPRWLVRGGVGSWLVLGLVIVISMGVFAIAHIVPVFVGVFIALVVTAILRPVVDLFARLMPRFPATFLALLAALGAVAGLVAYVVTSVTSQWARLADQFSSGVDTIIDFVEHGPLPVHLSQQDATAAMQELVSQGQRYVESNATSLAGQVLSNAGTVANVFVVLALALFTAIFFLASGARMWGWFLGQLPVHLRRDVHRAASAGWFTFAGYARGTVILALTDALLAGVFLQVVGVPLAAPLAVLVFIGAFIPMVGAPAAMIVAMIVALASKGFLAMVVVCLGVAGIGQIEGHVLQPLIMGRQVSLHPVVVLLAVAVGSFSAGLLGAVVAVPLVSVAWSVYSELHSSDTAGEQTGSLPALDPR